MKRIKEIYNNNGYVVVKKLFPKKDLDLIKYIAAQVFCSEFNLNFENYAKAWDCKIFNQKLIYLRKNNKSLFSYYYNIIQSNVIMKRIASNRKILNKIEKILSIKTKDLSHSICNLRIDAPNDTRNTYDWHQECSYYKQNENGHGIVVWVAARNISQSLGPLMACEGSNSEGVLVPKIIKKKWHSTQMCVPKEYVKKYKNKIKSFIIKEGDTIFMDMRTFHCSGFNTSENFRLSIVSRYHDNSKQDFRPFYDSGNYDFHKLKNSDLKKLFISK